MQSLSFWRLHTFSPLRPHTISTNENASIFSVKKITGSDWLSKFLSPGTFVSLAEMVGSWPVLLVVVVCLFAREWAHACSNFFVFHCKYVFIRSCVFSVCFFFCFLLSYYKNSFVAFCCIFYAVYFAVLFLLSRVFFVTDTLFWLGQSLE
jgi:hypothetical protein